MVQMGFFDLSDRDASLDAKRNPLVEIDAIVPWEEFRPMLEWLADRFRAYLGDRLEAFPGLSARRLHREVRSMGYEGAYSTLTEYLRLIRPAVPRQFERRFETAAGQQAQVDFAEFQVGFGADLASCARSGCSAWCWGTAAGCGGGSAQTRRWKL